MITKPAMKLPERSAGHRARLRERLRISGPEALPDYELLELLLTYAIARRDVKPLAKELIDRFGSLKRVLDASSEELVRVPSLGPQTATLLATWRALMQRYFKLEAKETDLVNSPEAAVLYCRAALEAEKNEIFKVLYLTTRNRLIKAEQISKGTIDWAAVYPRRIIEGALAAKAAALICVHNHPSGNPEPSQEDRSMTKSLLQLTLALGITLCDHIIIGQGRYFSFREQGLLGE